MVRFIGMLFITLAGAAIGGIIGLIGGAAFLESGRTACEAASCADMIVRSFAPAGAVLGALMGLGKVFSMRTGRIS